jgi:hypothetical protein
MKIFSNTVKTVWRIVKDTTGKTQSVNTIMEINTEACQITDTKGIGNAFNNFFIQIAENLNNKHINVCKALTLLIAAYSDITTEMKIIPINKIEVINTIKSLKTMNLSGHDGIYNGILKNCTNVISKPFTFTLTPH